MLWSRQRTPFHHSARVTGPPDGVSEYPTATHDDDDGHATAFRKRSAIPAGLGVRSIRQRRPSHRSAKVVGRPELVTAMPTAMHAEGALHATPSRPATLAPTGFGVGCTLHLPPADRSTKVTPTFEAATREPTAIHEDGLVQVPNSS
jgi:hypothetical protein